MTITYKLNNELGTETAIGVSMFKDGNFVHCIPFDPDNKDYQEYLKWVAAGNTPTPAGS